MNIKFQLKKFGFYIASFLFIIFISACSTAPQAPQTADAGGGNTTDTSRDLKLKMDNDLKLKLDNDLKLKLKAMSRLAFFQHPWLTPGLGGTNWSVIAITPKGVVIKSEGDTNENYTLSLVVGQTYSVYILETAIGYTNAILLKYADERVSVPVGRGTNNDLSPIDLGLPTYTNGIITTAVAPSAFIDRNNSGQLDITKTNTDKLSFDSDSDGALDFFGALDKDLNGIPDMVEIAQGLKSKTDSDGDGIPDIIDNATLAASNQSGNSTYYYYQAAVAVDKNLGFYSGTPQWTNFTIGFSLDTNCFVYQTNFSQVWSNLVVEVTLDTNFNSKIDNRLAPEWSNRVADVCFQSEFSNFITNYQSMVTNYQTIISNNPAWYSNSVLNNTNGGESQAGALYVSLTGNDVNPGTKALPLLTIQKALDTIATNPSLVSNVFVAQGVYTTSSGLNASTSGLVITNSNIKISGGWDAAFSTQIGLSVLDGQTALYHIMEIRDVSDIEINGFVLNNGYANGVSPHNKGAGIYVSNMIYSILTNIYIGTNYANTQGGGLFMQNGRSNTIFATISSNRGSAGGGLYVQNSEFILIMGFYQNNTATAGGGGIDVENSTNITINASVIGNVMTSTLYGGAGITLKNCISNAVAGNIYSNVSSGYGGGLNLESTKLTSINANIQWNNANVTSGGAYSGGGGVHLMGAKDTVLTGNLSCNYSYLNGIAVDFSSACSNLNIMNCVMTNSLGSNSVIFFSAVNGNSQSIVLSNNRISGINGSQISGIAEDGSGGGDLAGHVLMANVFYTNALQIPYIDIFANDLTNITNVNDPSVGTGTGATAGSTNNLGALQ